MEQIGSETYSDADDPVFSFTPIANAPDFSTDLSSTSPSIISNISFIVQYSINGYTIQCDDSGGDSENCTINIEGEYTISYVW